MPDINTFSESSLTWAGRQVELRALHAAVRSATLAVVVRGIVGIGKTTFVERFRAEHDKGRSIAFTMRDYLSQEEGRNEVLAQRRIAFAIADELRVDGSLPQHIRVEEVSEGSLLREVLPAICRPDLPRLVIVIDDFDLLEGAALRRTWRDFFRTSKLAKPPLFVAIASDVWGATAPLSDDDARANTIRLPALTAQDLSELVTRRNADKVVPSPPLGLESVWRATRGIPLLWSELIGLFAALPNAQVPPSLDANALGLMIRVSTNVTGDRLRSALASATRAARVAIRLLSDAALTRQDLRDRMSSEPFLSATEIDDCLESLLLCGLLESDSERLAIAPTLLSAFAPTFLPDPSAGANERAAARAGLREAEGLARTGDLDAAVERLRAVVPGTPETALTLAHMLLDRSRTLEDPTADLTNAEILLRDLRTVRDPSISRLVNESLSRVFIRRALAMSPQKMEYRSLCDDILELDPDLHETDAELVIARLEVDDWTRHTQQIPSERLPDSTRQVLRRDRCWALVAERLAQWLSTNLEGQREYLRGQRLLEGVAHPLLEIDSPDSSRATFWPFLIATLDLLRTDIPDGASQLSGAAWLTFASAAPPHWRSEFAQAAQLVMTHDLRRALLTGSGADARAIVRAGALLPATRPMVLLIREVEQVIYDAIERPEHRTRLANSLGLCMRAMVDSWRALLPDIDTRVSDLATIFFDATEGDLPFVADESHTAWYGLLAAVDALQTPAGTAFLSRLQRTTASRAVDAITAEERADLERLLDYSYDVVERSPLSIPGLTTAITEQSVRGYRIVTKSDPPEPLLLRVFSLRGHDQGMVRLLRSLWDTERRTLATLSVTHSGRALTRFIDAHFDAETDRALLLTEWPGVQTLSEHLEAKRAGVLAAKERQRLWGHLAVLLESLQTLHRAGFIHRAITPSVIFLTPTTDSVDARVAPGLKLGHFEWSVYLRSLGSMAPHLSRRLTRYIAPEALRAALDVGEGLSGESFGSDLYAIGLVLFECLVRRLTVGELENYKTPQDYDQVAQQEHREWVESLRDDVRSRSIKRAGADSVLTSQERDILLSLLQFDLSQRPTTLDGVVKIAALLATLHADITGPVFLVTTLSKKDDMPSARKIDDGYDPRTDNRNIAFRLKTLLPQIGLAGSVKDLMEAKLAKIVQDELRGAKVYLNAHPGVFLLVLVSRSGVRFRVRPFEWGDHAETENKVEDPHIGFLEVGRHEDRPLEPPIAELDYGVTLVDVKEQTVNQMRRDFRAGTTPSWDALFRIAVDSDRQVQEHAEAERRQRIVADVLSLASAFEYESITEDVGFESVSSGEDEGGRPFSILKAADKAINLAERFAHVSDEDSQFELASQRTPIGRGIKVNLARSAFDTDSATIKVPVAALALPSNGVIRPSASIGAEALHARRRRIFRQVEDDSFLLDALALPGKTRYREGRDRKQPILDRLDKDKRLIADRSARVETLLVVQGPPATGKTSLAAEIIFRTLERASNARILVTTQGHEPLDNLLERVVSEAHQNDKARTILHELELVRIASGRHRKESSTVRQFYPHARAELLFRQIQDWSEREKGSLGLVGDVARIVGKELAGYISAPYSLQRRVQDSANLVFATVNSRHIELCGSASYDLVIVEEAARCFPIEVAGAMRLSRRWLLIGDHQQLPPFGFSAIAQAYDKWEALEVAKTRGEPDSEKTMQWLKDVKDNFQRYLNLFKHLHDTEGPHRGTLTTQWRMHPALGTVVSHAFYGGTTVRNPDLPDELSDLTRRRSHQYSIANVATRTAADFVKGKQLIWVDVDHARSAPECGESREAGGLLANVMERRTIVALLRIMKSPKATKDIAILTPYRSQAEHLRGLLNATVNRFDAFGVLDDRVFTVDSFQGRQAGAVVLSLVRNNVNEDPRSALGFLQQRERATVMFSRAEKLLVVVGSLEHFRRFENPFLPWLGTIIDHAEIVSYRSVISQEEHRKGAEKW